MPHRWNALKGWLAAALVAGVLAGCSVPVTQPGRPGAGRQVDQAEALSRDGDHVGSAKIYEALAERSPGELRDRFLLRAAHEYLQADRTEPAAALLDRVSTTLPSMDFALRAQVAAELALRSQRPNRALAELDRIPQPMSREEAPAILALRARALFALNRPAPAVSAALERERLLTTEQDVRANRRLIWEGLQRSASGDADFNAPPGAGPVLVGWLNLGRAALTAARNPFNAVDDLSDWRSRHPTHPANTLLTEEVLPELGADLAYPSQIALLLPLSGRQEAAGTAVRDGFLAALLQQAAVRRPLVKLYDSAAMGATTAYRRAIADGAQFVVGPLTKEEVASIAASGETSVLTLALNQLPDGAVAPPLLFQFALDPEEEARQVAQRIVTDGRLRGLVLLPNDAWGQRLFRAFDTELKALGGSIAGLRFYDPTAHDFSAPITQLLLLDESRARANALASTLGTRFEFEPRRRHDVQFIFMGAYPTQGRSLRPALRFHLAQDLPVYSTSEIYETDTQANHDLEGILFPHMPWFISPDAVSTALREDLSRHWPARMRSNSRLYAFGFDAYRIVPLLKAGRIGAKFAIPGMTGRLSVDDRGRIRRDLDWARIARGEAVPLTDTAATAAR